MAAPGSSAPGWFNCSVVSTSAELPICRNTALLGAGLALLGGLALNAVEVAALAIGATVIVLAPVAWIAGWRPPAAVPETR